MDNNDVEIVDSSEKKVRSIFLGTFFTVLVLLLGVSYGLIWGILFLIYTNNQEYSSLCSVLVSWDKALYIVQFISSGLHLISSVFQLIATSYDRESNIPKYIMGLRSCLVYIAGLVILIGINVSYFSNSNIDSCGQLKNLNLAYIITEWALLGSCICFVCVVCNITLLLKKRKKHDNRI